MKVGMWAVGLLVLSLFGVVLVNLFGNITVTDQLNYTTMKNTVEAAMYDSLDIAHYRTGFCLCTNTTKTADKWVFNDDSQYELIDITYDENGNDVCKSSKYKTCEAMYGEYRIKPKVFSESLIRRFAEMVNNSKDYNVVIQDIIEYPPKVSVRVTSKDREYSPTEDDSNGYTIVNQMDAIIEMYPGNTPNETVTPTTVPALKTDLVIKPVDEATDYKDEYVIRVSEENTRKTGVVQNPEKQECEVVSGTLKSGHTIVCNNVTDHTVTKDGKEVVGAIDAGTYNKLIKSYKIMSGDTDVTGEYNIKTENGKFIINKISLEIVCRHPQIVKNRSGLPIKQSTIFSYQGDNIKDKSHLRSAIGTYYVTVSGDSKNYICRSNYNERMYFGTCTKNGNNNVLTVQCSILSTPCRWTYYKDKILELDEYCETPTPPSCSQGDGAYLFTDGATGGPVPVNGCSNNHKVTVPICYCSR